MERNGVRPYLSRMSKISRSVLAAALAAFAAPRFPLRAADPAEPAPRPVLVELFTSLGCSTCPPADRLVSELAAKDPSVVPLAFHVDYWDRAAFRDPFSSAAWSERQAAYARRAGASQVFTPQAFVDGGEDVTGTDAARLSAAIAAARARPAVSLAVGAERERDRVRVTIAATRPVGLRDAKLELWAALVESGLETRIGGGENGGRTVANDFVVRALERVTRLPAGERSSTHSVVLKVPADAVRALGVAVFAREPGTLRVHGAARRAL
jgi:hypothetical protein